MEKKKFYITIITTFKKEVEVEAENDDEALAYVEENELDSALDTDDFETTYEVYKG